MPNIRKRRIQIRVDRDFYNLMEQKRKEMNVHVGKPINTVDFTKLLANKDIFRFEGPIFRRQNVKKNRKK